MRWLCALVLLAGCSDFKTVEVEPVGEDYTDWYRIDSVAAIPSHGDTYRIIYANDIARLRVLEGGGRYPTGSIIVKEIHDRDGDEPGALDYIAIMRMLEENDQPDGADLKSLTRDDGGWLFTMLSDGIDGDEKYSTSCWDDCHVASPYDGAFLDYAE